MSDAVTKRDSARTLRIGAVAYLNTKPLVYGLEREIASGANVPYELSYGVPAELADRLTAEQIDVALLPVIELAGLTGATVLPGLGITALGAVRSVVLATRRPIDRIRRVALDPESRTSNALVKLLFAEVWGGWPEFVRPREGADLEEILDSCDAAVRIGDKALADEREREETGASRGALDDVVVHDLAEAWYGHTGLPFVFAAWVSRAAIHETDAAGLAVLVDTLESSYRAGERHAHEIAREAARSTGLSEAVTTAYLTRDIRYRLGDAELRGLRRFLELAARHEIIDHAPELVLASRAATIESCEADRESAGAAGAVPFTSGPLTSGGTP